MQTQNNAKAIHLIRVTKHFSTSTGAHTAVRDMNLDVDEGVFLSVVGPSGCGKSTVLNIAAGLTDPSEGSVEIYGKPLQGLNQHASYMFQHDALLPWKTVAENVTLGLTFEGKHGAEALESGRNWIKRVGLDGFADSFPHQLSGGMRAAARSTNPKLGFEPEHQEPCTIGGVPQNHGTGLAKLLGNGQSRGAARARTKECVRAMEAKRYWICLSRRRE